MSYFDVWKKKMMLNGGNEIKSIQKQTQDLILKRFKDTNAYYLARIERADGSVHDLDVRVINADRSVSEKRFYVLPNTKLLEGEYITYNDRTFIIKEFEDNSDFPFAKGQLCNQHITWKGLNGKKIPCTMTNNSYGSKGLIAESDQLYNFDSRAVIVVQKNKLTDTICEGQRFIFNNSKTDVYEVTKKISSLTLGSYQLICRYTKWMAEDDFETNEAWQPNDSNNPDINIEYNLIGDANVKINSSDIEYTIYPYVNCDWMIDDTRIAEITYKNGNVCRISVNSFKDEMFVLKAITPSGGIYASKVIITTK